MKKGIATLLGGIIFLAVAAPRNLGIMEPQPLLSTLLTSVATHPKWYGVGEDWALWSSDPMAAWTNLIPKLKYWKFNTVRLAFAFADSPPNPEKGTTAHSKLDYTKLSDLLNILDSNGIKAILDCHNYQDMYGWFGSDAWVNDWVSVAQTYKGDTRIVAFEIFNEPYEGTWDRTKVNSYYDVAKALKRCVDAISATGDDHPIVYPTPLFLVSGDAGNFPYELKPLNVVLGIHDWTSANTLDQALRQVEGHKMIVQNWMSKGWLIWTGEFGFNPDSGVELPWDAQKAFCVGIINHDIEKEIGFTCWMYYFNQARWDEILSASKCQPTFTISSLLISPTEVFRGETVSISVDMVNTGDVIATYTPTLKINDVVEATKEVTLAGGESVTVTFEVAWDVEGTHNVEVDGLTGAFTVNPSPIELWLSYIGVAIVAILATAALVIIRRKYFQKQSMNREMKSARE